MLSEFVTKSTNFAFIALVLRGVSPRLPNVRLKSLVMITLFKIIMRVLVLKELRNVDILCAYIRLVSYYMLG